MTTVLLAAFAAAVLGALSGLHLYWAAGGRWAAASALPTKPGSDQPVFRPRPLETAVVGMLLAACGVFVLARAGLLTVPLPKALLHYGLWVLGSLFVLRALGEGRYVGFFKRVRGTPFGRLDTRYYSPLCLGLGCLLLALAAMLHEA